MSAVPELGEITGSVDRRVEQGAFAPARARRAVAVAVSPMELLRPGSDLVRLLEDAVEIDVLIACEDAPTGQVRPLGHLDYDDYDDEDYDEAAGGDDGPQGPAHDEIAAGAAALGLRDLQLHRLGLRPPLGPGAEADLVAAVSELVGFDPEPGVYCLAPMSSDDPGGIAVDRAVQRIARVYGLPLLRYRCLELSVVGDGR